MFTAFDVIKIFNGNSAESRTRLLLLLFSPCHTAVLFVHTPPLSTCPCFDQFPPQGPWFLAAMDILAFAGCLVGPYMAVTGIR